MLDRLARLLEVSPTVVAILIALVVAQLAVQVYALVDLARRDTVLGAKWLWAIVIVLGNLLGAIAYLVAGRVVTRVDTSDVDSGAGEAGGASTRRAVDMLYGSKNRE